MSTPLHIAVQNGNIDIIRALLASGADVNALDADGKTPLGIATEANNVEIVNLLLQYHRQTTLISPKRQFNWRRIMLIGCVAIIACLVCYRTYDYYDTLDLYKKAYEKDLPIQIDVRESWLTAMQGKKSYVLVLTNLCNEDWDPLYLQVTARDGSTGSWTLHLQPFQKNYEVGLLETGWTFMPGDVIHVSGNVWGYNAIEKQL